MTLTMMMMMPSSQMFRETSNDPPMPLQSTMCVSTHQKLSSIPHLHLIRRCCYCGGWNVPIPMVDVTMVTDSDWSGLEVSDHLHRHHLHYDGCFYTVAASL
jgi:hypothetical protein